MLRRCHLSVFVAVICVALVDVQRAEASRSHHHYQRDDPNCVFRPDFSTVESSLRSAIFLAKTEEAAKIFSSNELFSLGAGLTYRDNETCLLVRTSMRAKDPDIVAIQALAINAAKTGETEKLARAVVLSFELECKCSLFTIQEKEQMVKDIKSVLDDPQDRKEILEFGRTAASGHSIHAATYATSGYGGRRLVATETSPTNSDYCAHCEPDRQCRKSGLRWCPSK